MGGIDMAAKAAKGYVAKKLGRVLSLLGDAWNAAKKVGKKMLKSGAKKALKMVIGKKKTAATATAAAPAADATATAAAPAARRNSMLGDAWNAAKKVGKKMLKSGAKKALKMISGKKKAAAAPAAAAPAADAAAAPAARRNGLMGIA